MRELELANSRLDGRYDIHEELGRGSYAEIFVARNILASPHSPHTQVVIKALNVFLQDDLDDDLERTLVENFQNEAVALDRVRHPNIISRIGHGTARDLRGTVFHYLVLEYMAGGNLQSLIRKQKLTLPHALALVEQVCAGLGHAHSRGIIHRDIKPQNLLLNADHSTVKIADFGVARFSLTESPITRVGTNIYAAPEHSPLAAGQTGKLSSGLTPAADIYSLAKTVYTLLTCEAPRNFAGQPIDGMPESVRDEEWAHDLARVLKRATATDAGDRHQSVEDFWRDLAGVRQIASEGEFSTQLRPKLEPPQPHVARGYSPVTPAIPEFKETGDLARKTVPTASVFVAPSQSIPSADKAPVAPVSAPVSTVDAALPPQKKRTRSRRFITFVVFAGLFTGLLYGTASYMRGRGVLPEIRNPFSERVAVASTDIYLRPGPNTDNPPIGLVTKNSRVRIVNSSDNWYQVDVIEQGRIRPSNVSATRGWLNGRYLDITEN